MKSLVFRRTRSTTGKSRIRVSPNSEVSANESADEELEHLRKENTEQRRADEILKNRVSFSRPHTDYNASGNMPDCRPDLVNRDFTAPAPHRLSVGGIMR